MTTQRFWAALALASLIAVAFGVRAAEDVQTPPINEQLIVELYSK